MYEINEAIDAPAADGSDDLELSDIFYTNNKKRNVFQVKLTSRGFCLLRDSAGGTKEQNVELNDIIGGRCMRFNKNRRSLGKACTCSSSSTSISRSRNSPKHIDEDDYMDASAYLYVFAYVLKKNLRSTLRRERTVLTLRFRSFDKFEDNIHEAEKWNLALKYHKKKVLVYQSHVLTGDQRRLLILLNPKSGPGKARELFHQQILPVLNEAEIPYDLYVTKHANYARDFVRIKSISTWAGIIVVGGDGLFHEVLNGLLQRADWEEVLPKTPIGIVPCGSGNGLARTIAHLYK